MSLTHVIAEGELRPIESPHREPRELHQMMEPRKVNNLTLIDGKTFLSTTVAGDIQPPGAADVGFFHQDTRFLSELELRIDGHRSIVLSSSTEKNFASQIELTTGNITLRDSFDLPANTVHIRREQLLATDVFFDRFGFENFNLTPVEINVELFFDADFVDVFQVRGLQRQVHGQYYAPEAQDGKLVFAYKGRDDVFRETIIKMSPAPDSIEDRRALWRLRLEPYKLFSIEVTVTPYLDRSHARITRSEKVEQPRPRHVYDFSGNLRDRRAAFAQWESESTIFQSSNDVFNTCLSNNIGDFHALRIPVGHEHIIAAGIPWFATIFGRDSLISSYEILSLNPSLAKDTLRVLARFQATEVDDWRDEEPGKVLHEHREGEMTYCDEMPFGAYYGSVDATPLFLILLSEVYNWTADERLVRELQPNIYRCLEWMDKYGDLDGDGFLEYRRRSPKGLYNQGWKDSGDAIIFPSGKIAEDPIALAEVQGYAFDAKYRTAGLLRTLGDGAAAERLKREAAVLAKKFDKAFWIPEKNYYAIALDRHKTPVPIASSNPGHLLWSRIITRDRARAVTERLMKDDIFSGWGLRTVAQSEPVFNPMSYHRGTVWPHDNALIVHGMSLNEHRHAAAKVLTNLFQAAMHFRDYRLPELFCGVQRREHDVPVHYPVSCSPQAWASGALFLMLTSVLGIRPSAPRKELNIINPHLPEWLDHLHVRNLHIGKSRVGLDFTRRNHRTFCNVVDVEGEKLMINVMFRK